MSYRDDMEMEELVPIVAELSRAYAGCDSTSVSFETAEALMEGVLYCLNEVESSGSEALYDKTMSVWDKYQIGAKLVQEKAKKLLLLFNEVTVDFDDYGVTCLGDTVIKGIPEFLRWYDARFFPQNTILTLDYPVLCNMSGLCGVDAVYKYMRAVCLEQRFLHHFERSDVVAILMEMVPGYKGMIENVAGVLLWKVFLDACETRGGAMLMDVRELEDLFERTLKGLLNAIGEDDGEMYEYLRGEASEVAVRVASGAMK